LYLRPLLLFRGLAFLPSNTSFKFEREFSWNWIFLTYHAQWKNNSNPI